jgi:8-oxo-dGTP diphosphatase
MNTQEDDLRYYFRSAFSATVVIFALVDGKLNILLQRRDKEPYKGKFGLPACMLYPNDVIEDRVEDLLRQTTGTAKFYKKQIRAFTDTTRHPLGRVISIGFYAMVNFAECVLADNAEFVWMEFRTLPALPFDHNDISEAAHRRLLSKLSTQLAGFELLPELFTLKQLQEMYESVLGHSLDKRNFRRKVLRHDVVQETGQHLQPWHESGKAPMLYRLDRETYDRNRSLGKVYDLF